MAANKLFILLDEMTMGRYDQAFTIQSMWSRVADHGDAKPIGPIRRAVYACF